MLLLPLDRAGREDRGDGAPGPDDEGHERFAAHADLAKQTVEEEAHAGEVPRGVKKGEKQEEDE